MRTYLQIFLFILFTGVFSVILPQEEEVSDTTEANDSWAWEDDSDDDTTTTDDSWAWEDDIDIDLDIFSEKYKSPSITLGYGFSNMKRSDFSEQFAEPVIPEIKLGYTTGNPTKYSGEIYKYTYRYLYLSNITTELRDNAINDGDLRSELWRFGYGSSSGYGYDLGDAAIIPYYTYNFGWSRLALLDIPGTEHDKSITDNYNESMRFGTGWEGGIRFKIFPAIILEAGYERSVIFQRHLFWKWAGSAVLEAASQALLDSFIKKIITSSPTAGPIVNFVLKNALAYGVYELRQDKMNWPFNSAPPLAYDQFKFGMTFNF